MTVSYWYASVEISVLSIFNSKVRLGLVKTRSKITRHSQNCVDEEIDGLVQERRNPSALAMELRLSCTNHRYNYWAEFELTQHPIPVRDIRSLLWVLCRKLTVLFRDRTVDGMISNSYLLEQVCPDLRIQEQCLDWKHPIYDRNAVILWRLGDDNWCR